jgi:hypothetical protein
MALIQSGVDSTLLTVDPTFKAARVVIKPDELTGAFQLAVPTGAITTIAANAPLFSFRWAPGTGALCVVKRISVGFVCTTAFGTAQSMGFGAYVARSFSGSDSGQTAVVLTGNNNKYRTSLATSQVTDARVSGTAAITVGTRTLDANALGLTYFWVPGAGTSLTQTDLISYDANDYPIVLANNEGIVINNLVLMGATGVGNAVINIEWFEANAY